MFEHDEKLCGTSVKEVPFETTPEYLALLLDLIDNRPISQAYCWSDIEAVMSLGVRFGFLHLNQLVLGHINLKRPTGNPWKVFALASRLDHPLIAHSTLADFRHTHLWARESNTVKAKDMMGVTGAYATALLRAMRLNVSGDARMIYHPVSNQWAEGRETDWTGVAKEFDLERWSVSSRPEDSKRDC
jgi:hypothetical protein